MPSTRRQFLSTTCDLMEEQGYHATGLNQIVSESGAPKGSLYYYFPDGKEQLAAEAIAHSAEIVAARIAENLSAEDDFPGTLRRFIRRIAAAVEASGFRSGGPLMAVALETATTSRRLNHACRDAYGLLQKAFATRFERDGFVPQRAQELAVFATAAIEGGILLSRTAHSGDPLRHVADELSHYFEAISERAG
jgi:TetR/AcrR family transcriptional repressor of lmrAB and yxaGH operons